MALGTDGGVDPVFLGEGAFPSAFAVTDFATATVAAAGLEVARLLGGERNVTVDRRMASWWFLSTVRPEGWQLPPAWDAVAGDYRTADGWIRLHTNAPHHRAAALAVLGTANERDAVAAAVAGWKADELEAAVVAANGCAAAMRSAGEWTLHPQGASVAAEPLIAWSETDDPSPWSWQPTPERPLAGLRVLDLTRVLAGPVATRFLAGYGADVLRIDPPWWEEPGVATEVTLGKRCARLDLRTDDGRRQFEHLLASADVFVHGYRSDALERLGLGDERLRAIAPGLVDVALDAYGWTGPWSKRRGFDSLVQMSCGIADAGMRTAGNERPTPLPAQALDHGTGYLIAAAVLQGVRRRAATGRGVSARLSLARTARLLQSGPAGSFEHELAPVTDGDNEPELEATSWGPARRLRPPLAVEGAEQRWERPATSLGSHAAEW
ncbi:acyl-CoA transferase [bacterium SCGC AG-212-C10]|nr:acyl-CoA transferase [bacterium SCGC AG-212-C10]